MKCAVCDASARCLSFFLKQKRVYAAIVAIFFILNLPNSAELKCNRDNVCDMDSNKRKICASCRFLRCFIVGMGMSWPVKEDIEPPRVVPSSLVESKLPWKIKRVVASAYNYKLQDFVNNEFYVRCKVCN